MSAPHNIDQIVQSDKQAEGITSKNREFPLQKKYLNFPVKNGAKKVAILV